MICKKSATIWVFFLPLVVIWEYFHYSLLYFLLLFFIGCFSHATQEMLQWLHVLSLHLQITFPSVCASGSITLKLYLHILLIIKQTSCDIFCYVTHLFACKYCQCKTSHEQLLFLILIATVFVSFLAVSVLVQFILLLKTVKLCTLFKRYLQFMLVQYISYGLWLWFIFSVLQKIPENDNNRKEHRTLLQPPSSGFPLMPKQ